MKKAAYWFIVLFLLYSFVISCEKKTVISAPDEDKENTNTGQDNSKDDRNPNPGPPVPVENCLAAVGYHNLLIYNPEKTLWASGDNEFGQLGDLYPNGVNHFIKLADGVIAIAAAGRNSLYIAEDNSFWTAGEDVSDEIEKRSISFTKSKLYKPIKFISTTSNVGTPPVTSNFGSAPRYYAHTLCITTDNQLWGMGSNIFGQIDNRRYDLDRYSDMLSSNVIAAAAGSVGSYFIKNDGTLWSSENDRQFYQPVTNDVIAVTAGPGGQIFIIRSDHSLWGKGKNDFGQLGISGNPTEFVKITDNVRSVEAGLTFSLLIKSDSSLWISGSYFSGTTSGNTGNYSQFTKIEEKVKSAAIGSGYTAPELNRDWDEFALIIKTDNTLWAAGSNKYGQLGDGTFTDKSTFVKVADNVKAVAAGSRHSLILKTDNSLWGAGENTAGQLGDIFRKNKSRFEHVFDNVIKVVGNGNNSYVLRADHTLLYTMKHWSLESYLFPKIETYTAIASDVLDISASGTLNSLVKMDHTLWMLGQSGTPDTKIADNVRSTEEGNYFLTDDNSLWGYFIGDPIPRITINKITDNVKAIASGGGHLLILKNDSTLWGMGDNTYGQLGLESYSRQSIPVKISDKVAGIAAGLQKSFFIKGDNSLWFAGNSYMGESGTSQKFFPRFTRVAWNVKAVATGLSSTIIKKTDGTYWTTGENQYGQLGDGTTTNKTSFTRINFP